MRRDPLPALAQMKARDKLNGPVRTRHSDKFHSGRRLYQTIAYRQPRCWRLLAALGAHLEA
jgi:hypothetical protein